MSNNSFTFQKFTIHQDRCAMKVGTDGVLLGAWAHGGKRILDIGTGTGLVAIMMAQRFADAHVTAVEIDHNAALQACYNAKCSPFASRIGIVETSIQNFEVYGTQLFDSIVSNPPFFTDSLKNHDSQRATARHADTLTYRDLFTAVKRLLVEDGEFSAIIPSNCLTSFIAEAYLAHLVPIRQLAIRTTPRKQPKRILVSFGHTSSESNATNKEQCLMNPDGSRSDWYINLTSDFYL
ncbi:methyltransferase [uncultured Prevotella sp.]|uniref:tRNA1(Val) (adenine(37)-N6)-methyltransferase n=1 Tax=uncultured Prevotella sp. TaxID=159272 RepID=UPI0027E288A2|nr:methyltransferase [uncultured Prevotella sp.]